MKLKSFILIILLLKTPVLFAQKTEIPGCYLNFNNAPNLSATAPDKIPLTKEKVRRLITESGEMAVSVIDEFRINYNNRRKEPSVNVIIDLSAPGQYIRDTTVSLENLRYQIGQGTDYETSDLIELNYNGYKIYGSSRDNIETDNPLGFFIMFPGDDIIIRFHLNNISSKPKGYRDLDDYKRQRNSFLAAFTNHLNSCRG